MTPQEQNDLDSLKQELRQTQKLLDDSKGRIKAVELDSYETKRNAKLAIEQAEALKAETTNALITASEQLKCIHAVAFGIFGIAELGRAFMSRKVSAARVVYREVQTLEDYQAIMEAVNQGDLNKAKSLTERVSKKIATLKANGENARAKFMEYSLAMNYKITEDMWQSLLSKENTHE